MHTQFQGIICIFGFAMAEENTGNAAEITFKQQFLEFYLSFVEINDIFGILRPSFTSCVSF